MRALPTPLGKSGKLECPTLQLICNTSQANCLHRMINHPNQYEWETFCIGYAKFLLVYRDATWHRGMLFWYKTEVLYRRHFVYGVHKIAPIYTSYLRLRYTGCRSNFYYTHSPQTTVMAQRPYKLHTKLRFYMNKQSVLYLQL